MLTAEQTDSLRAAERRYRRRVDTVWVDLAAYLSTLPDQYDLGAVTRRVEDATTRAWEIVKEQRAELLRILSPLQMAMLPSTVRYILETPGPVNMRIF